MSAGWTTYTPADIPRLAELTPPARFAVFGDPVAHSRSPQMHNAALQELGLGAQYVRIHVRPEEFADAVRACQQKGFLGINCTIPHKHAALAIADEADPLARRLGVANTLAFRGGKIHAWNTDGVGLTRALSEEFELDPQSQRVLILGAGGGAGRAAAIYFALAGCPHLALANRTREKIERLAEELAALMPAERISLQTEPCLEDVDLVINATSVGMKPDDPPLIPPTLFQPRHVVFDMIYSPPETRLLRDAQAAGARIANGLSMLLHQGAASLEHWLERPAPVDAMRRGLMESF